MIHGVGARITGAQAAIQTPNAVLQATMLAGIATPAVATPKVNPAAA